MKQFIEKHWYGEPGPLRGLAPIESLYRRIVCKRAKRKNRGLIPAAVPVVVIGNISVGGTGKTPLIIALAKSLKSRGARVAVISKGYGRKSKADFFCEPDNPKHLKLSAEALGDEPKLIFTEANVHLAVGQDRGLLRDALIHRYSPDIILTDDGMQDYSFVHDFEIAVVDGMRQLGNKRLLPVGPLREPHTRLQACRFNCGKWNTCRARSFSN